MPGSVIASAVTSSPDAQPGQPALLLLVVAERVEVRHDDVGVQRHREAALVGARELLHDDHRAQEVAARAAVLLVEPRAQEALRARLAPDLAIDLTLLAPALLVRSDLAVDELAKRLAERVVVGIEQRAVHRVGLVSPCWQTRAARRGMDRR